MEMNRTDIYNNISSMMQQMGIPVSVVHEILDEINKIQPANTKYTCKQQSQNGVYVFDIEATNERDKHFYKIILDSNKQEYSIEINRDTFSLGNQDGYEHSKITVNHTQSAWDTKPGYIINKEGRDSHISTIPNTNETILYENSHEGKSYFNDKGIEMRRFSTRKQYPEQKVKYNGKLEISGLYFRTAEKTYETYTDRQGLQKAIYYVTEKDMMGNVVKQNTMYQYLSNTHGLSVMEFLDPVNGISKENFESLPETYSKEDLESLLENDHGISKEALMEQYQESQMMK